MELGFLRSHRDDFVVRFSVGEIVERRGVLFPKFELAPSGYEDQGWFINRHDIADLPIDTIGDFGRLSACVGHSFV